MNHVYLASLVAVLFAVSAHAHLEVGTYQGKTASGEACSMQVLGQHFENGVHHPLNERVQIRVDGQEFVVGHPPVVDVAQSLAYFNHDLFQGVLPTDKGSKALVIEMVHAENQDGPRAFHVIHHEWREDVRSVLQCQELKFQR